MANKHFCTHCGEPREDCTCGQASDDRHDFAAADGQSEGSYGDHEDDERR